MIAILFLLVLVGLTVVLSLMGAGPGNVLIWQSVLLVGLFCLSSAPASMWRRRSACWG